MEKQLTSSLSEVETDWQSDVVDRVVGSSPSSLSDELSPETDLIPEPRAETLPPSKYGRIFGNQNTKHLTSNFEIARISNWIISRYPLNKGTYAR